MMLTNLTRSTRARHGRRPRLSLPLSALFIAALLNALLIPAVADENPPSIPPEVLAAQQARIEVMDRASAATISIFGLEGEGGGSGVIITPDGYALTNFHVSSACGDHMRCGLNDGSMVDAVIVGIDATGDVSLIQLLGRDDFPTAPLADSSQVRIGQWCFAAGNPFVLATNRQPSVSLGIVSGVGRYQYPAGTLLEYADCIQTDAAVNPGNSGGPLFDLAGQVIGINGRCSFEKRGRVNVGVGYAISANQIKYFLGALKSGRLVDHATLGATVSTDPLGQVVVSNILNNSDAYRRGLRFGDEVTRLADREVRTTNEFKNILGTLPRDWRVPIEVRRGDKTETLLVRLDGVHSQQQLIELVAGGLDPRAKPKEAPPSKKDELKEGEDQATDDEQSSPQGVDDTDAANGGATKLAPGQPDVELVASMLEKRPGYANYYYNARARQRLQSSLEQLGPFAESTDNWSLTGTLAGETTPISLAISPASGQIKLGSRALQTEFGDELSKIVSQRREAGLLLALRALQQALRGGVEKMGSCSYLGTFPVYRTSNTALNQQPLHDVLEIAWYDAMVRLSIEPETGHVSLIEVFGDDGVDPVEVYCDNYRDVAQGEQSCAFPHRLRLQYGTEPLLLMEVEQIDLQVEIKSDEPGDAP